jgi:photosystem II stability/assembly factor-like uncharacterized protein
MIQILLFALNLRIDYIQSLNVVGSPDLSKRGAAMRILRVSVFILLLTSPHLFSQWSIQSSPTKGYLSDIQFVGSQVGYIVGQGGTLLRTTDGGAQWSMQTFAGLNLWRLKFTSPMVGWIVGSTSGKHGLIMKTTDGGGTWITQDSSFQKSYATGVCFQDASRGWVVVSASYPDTVGSIYRTIDGGARWQPVSDPRIAWPNDVVFTDSLTGFVVGEYGAIVKTTDGGISWREVFRAGYSASGGKPAEEPLRRIVFTDKNHGWAVGGISGVETKVRTTDGGNTWQNSFIPMGGGSLQGLWFTDSQNGWAVGGVVSGPIIERTTDGGATWGRQTHALAKNNLINLWAVCMTSNNEGYVVGDSGYILKTTNGGGSSQLMISGVSDHVSEIPNDFVLSQNYPNPFNPTTRIEFALTRTSQVTLVVRNVLGQTVSTILEGAYAAGIHVVTWHGRDPSGIQLPSGAYFYTLKTSDFSITKAMVLLK